MDTESHSGRPCTSRNEEVKDKFPEVFFDSRGIVHLEYALEGQAVNKEFYLGVLH